MLPKLKREKVKVVPKGKRTRVPQSKWRTQKTSTASTLITTVYTSNANWQQVWRTQGNSLKKLRRRQKLRKTGTALAKHENQITTEVKLLLMLGIPLPCNLPQKLQSIILLKKSLNSLCKDRLQLPTIKVKMTIDINNNLLFNLYLQAIMTMIEGGTKAHSFIERTPIYQVSLTIQLQTTWSTRRSDCNLKSAS